MIPKTIIAAACLALGAGGAAAFEARLVKASEATVQRPHDLTLTSDGLYLLVADVGNHVVKVLVPGTLETIGVIGEGELSSPHDVDIDARGRVLIADSGNDRTVLYSFDGVGHGGAIAERLAVWDRDQGSPEGVAAGTGGRVYVTNASLNTVIQLNDGAVTATMETSVSGPLDRPHDIEADHLGRVFAADPGNNRILVLDQSLGFVSSLEGPPFDFNEPKYLAVDEKGWLFVADELNNLIKVFDDAYRPVGTVGLGDGLNQPEGVAVAGRYIWVSDTYNNRILLYRRE